MTLERLTYDVENLRQHEFPVANDVVYLNHASISPMPQRTRRAIQDAVDGMSMNASQFFFEQGLPLFETFMQSIAAYINAEHAEEIAPIQSTSTGLNLVAQSLDWQPGDEIIFCETEFPSNAYPWMSLERDGVKCVLVPAENGTLSVAQLEQALTPRTRLVAVSALQFFSGGRADLMAIGEFCRQHDLIFSVDAIQAIGHMPIDVQVMNIGVLSCGAQKSMMALTGSGFLYVRRDLAEQMRPRSIGPNATEGWEHWLKFDVTPREGAMRFMMGTPNVPGMFSVISSLQLFEELGRAAIDAHTTHLATLAIEGLTERGFNVVTPAAPTHHGPIITFAYDDTHDKTDAFMKMLKQNNVVATKHLDAPGNPHVRISVHCYNVQNDIQYFLNLL